MALPPPAFRTFRRRRYQPVAGQHVVIEAVVTATFNTNDGLGGIFVEEEASDRDDNLATSEGLFVYAPTLNAEPGQRLRLAGEVTEYDGLTELTNLGGTENCGTSELPPPTNISLPWADATAPEAFESMRVQFSTPLVVNDNYDLGRYGSLTLGSGRHFIPPTSIAEPGADAALVLI